MQPHFVVHTRPYVDAAPIWCCHHAVDRSHVHFAQVLWADCAVKSCTSHATLAVSRPPRSLGLGTRSPALSETTIMCRLVGFHGNIPFKSLCCCCALKNCLVETGIGQVRNYFFKCLIHLVVVFLPPAFCCDWPSIGRILYLYPVINHVNHSTSTGMSILALSPNRVSRAVQMASLITPCAAKCSMAPPWKGSILLSVTIRRRIQPNVCPAKASSSCLPLPLAFFVHNVPRLSGF